MPSTSAHNVALSEIGAHAVRARVTTAAGHSFLLFGAQPLDEAAAVIVAGAWQRWGNHGPQYSAVAGTSRVGGGDSGVIRGHSGEGVRR